MRIPAFLLLAAALPALADSRFQIRRMNRDDVPLGKGQCEIRLQVDAEVEVSVRGDMVSIRTISGQNARDDGSQCSGPMPTHDIQNFSFEVKEARNEIRLIAEPSVRNEFSAVVSIRDTSGGFGRYRFRLTWSMRAIDSIQQDRTRVPGGFSWNNAVSFKGNGSGDAWLNDFGPVHLQEVNIEIDHGGKVLVSFRAGRGRGITFNGMVVSREGNRWKADVASDDNRYRGPLLFDADDKGNVRSLSIDAGDGRDRMTLNWDRR